ncbi:MAG TPA: YfhO family protein [Pyrinomonadaceae bacterium]|jgi:hypothetical protein
MKARLNSAGLRQAWRTRRMDAAALCVITLFFALFFSWVFLKGQFVVGRDAFVYSYPLRSIAWDALRRGTLPLWTPLLMSGYPLLSMQNIGIGYPLTWAHLLLPAHWAEQLYLLAPFLLAPAFTYAYARAIKLSRLASLLAGLVFGYGGMMTYALGFVGQPTNTAMWLPLVLIAIERARTRPFIGCLIKSTAAYSLSVLAGFGQFFVFIGLIAIAYAAFIALALPNVSAGKNHETGSDDEPKGRTAWERLRPLAVAIGATGMSAGLAAFQVLETMRAVRRSVRSHLSYEIFSAGSFTPLLALKSFLAPLNNTIETTAYVPPLALGLAALAAWFALRRKTVSDARILFWLAAAAVACVLMLGSNTPLYRLLYYVPVLNRFRVPSRHAFEWTFAVAILSAYGWDALLSAASRKGIRSALGGRFAVLAAATALALGLLLGVLWWKAALSLPVRGAASYTGLKDSSYLLWKAAFTILTLFALWQGLRVPFERWRRTLLLTAIMLVCFVEPFIGVERWWWALSKPASRFGVPSPATRFLQNYPPEQNRVYTRVNLWAEEYGATPRLDGPNLTAIYGLHNVAGYEPLVLERYSRALGNVGIDTVNPWPGFAPDLTLFDQKSHVLDLLNTRFVASFSNLSTEAEAFEPQALGPPLPANIPIGIRPQSIEHPVGVGAGGTNVLTGAREMGDALLLVTTLMGATDAADGDGVARLRIFTSDGRVIERELRAGIETAEWMHESPEVLASVRHRLAPVYDSRPGDADNTFTAYRYLASMDLGERVQPDRIEITNLTGKAALMIWRASIYDSATARSTQLLTTVPLKMLDAARWQTVYDSEGVLILRNERALPRAWLVAEAEAVDGEEALRRIRGESASGFDPRRTALLEIPPQEMPVLPGGPVSSGSDARITTYEANALEIETVSEASSVLILSEISYPGWIATVDGAQATLYTTDFLLRGVAVPAGRHRVVMRYTAPAARNGAFVSLSTLVLLIGLGIYSIKARRAKRG